MERIKIISNGTVLGTMVLNADGKPIPGIRRIELSPLDAHDRKGGGVQATLVFAMVDLEITAEVNRTSPASDMGQDSIEPDCPHETCDPAACRCASPADQVTGATRDVLAERRRQVTAEGWTPEHDDQYIHGDMSSAAGCYATQGRHHYPTPGNPPPNWPWAAEWWKPKDYRRNLVRAGALILAEIERLDRAAERASKEAR